MSRSLPPPLKPRHFPAQLCPTMAKPPMEEQGRCKSVLPGTDPRLHRSFFVDDFDYYFILIIIYYYYYYYYYYCYYYYYYYYYYY
jgi:hypothetical protein